MKENSKGEGATKMFEGELLSLQVRITLEKTEQPNHMYWKYILGRKWRIK